MSEKNGPFEIDITGIDHAELLAALHNGTCSIGLGVLHDIGRSLSRDEAAEMLSKRTARHDESIWFDYVLGRPVKVGFIGNTLRRPDLYDRDCPTGRGSCERIVEKLRAARSTEGGETPLVHTRVCAQYLDGRECSCGAGPRASYPTRATGPKADE